MNYWRRILLKCHDARYHTFFFRLSCQDIRISKASDNWDSINIAVCHYWATARQRPYTGNEHAATVGNVYRDCREPEPVKSVCNNGAPRKQRKEAGGGRRGTTEKKKKKDLKEDVVKRKKTTNIYYIKSGLRTPFLTKTKSIFIYRYTASFLSLLFFIVMTTLRFSRGFPVTLRKCLDSTLN
jgi:hypothetical protein